MKLYNVVVRGELLPNFTQDQVQENLIRFLKIPSEYAVKFFQKATVNIKKEVTVDESRRYLAALEKCGLQGYLEEVITDSTDLGVVSDEEASTSNEANSAVKTPLKSNEQSINISASESGLNSLSLMSDEEELIASKAHLTAKTPLNSINISGSESGLNSLSLMSDEEALMTSKAHLTAKTPLNSINISGSESGLNHLSLISDEEALVLSEANIKAQSALKSNGKNILLSTSDSTALDELCLVIDDDTK